MSGSRSALASVCFLLFGGFGEVQIHITAKAALELNI